MDKYAFVFLIYFFIYSKTECRSWYKSDKEIAFEDYKDPWWHYTDKDSEEWGHHSGEHESSYKHLKNWNPDNVWFPDFDKYYTTSSTSSSPRQVTTTLSPVNVEECIRECPTTSEYNPVCGTNRITYSNIGRLDCARRCGVDVKLHRKVPCSLDRDPSTTENSPTESDSQRQCIENCPATPEYNPICGTNNVTYQNRGKLECAKACGVDVELKRLSPCPRPITTESEANKDLVKSKDEATWITSTNANIFTRPTETPDKPKFTISQDILNSIFNIPTTDSNEADIDIRAGE